MIILLRLILFFSLCFIGCKNRLVEEDNCNYENRLGEQKNGKYECYYEDGIISETGWLENDSLKIERYIYFPSGELKEYKFYNIRNELRYLRKYNKQGTVIGEDGDFFSQIIISSTNEIMLGDSLVLDLYVANPPNTEFKVYGIDGDNRYELNNRSTINFKSKHVIKPEKVGVYVFIFEVDFLDKITNESQKRRDEFVFEVK